MTLPMSSSSASWRMTRGSSILSEITFFIALCVVVFGVAFLVIPSKQGADTPGFGQARAGKTAGYAGALSLPKDEQERLKRDIGAIQKNIASKNKQDVDTFAPQYVRMAGIYEALGLLPQAHNAYARAIEEDTESVDARVGLGNVYIAQERYGDAKAAYRVIIALHKNDPRGYLALADLYFLQLKDEETARITYLRGLLATDNDASIARAYANFLETIGRNYESYLYWSEVVKGNPDDTEAKKHREFLKPSVEDAIRATEQGSKQGKK